MKEIPSGYPFLHKKQVQNNEKQLFRLLIGLNIGGAVLLGIFFLGSFLWGEKRLDSEMKVYFGKKRNLLILMKTSIFTVPTAGRSQRSPFCSGWIEKIHGRTIL